jgi:hypothetical protein
VGHDDAERRIDLERLGVLAASPADRRVAGVSDADVAPQAWTFTGEDVADEPLPSGVKRPS